MTKSKEHAEDTCSLVYQCRLALSTSTVNHLTDLLRRHLKAIRSRWRILPPGRIAVIVLAVLRHDQVWPTWPAATTCPSPPSAAGATS
ncbi:hypothetical protein [Streptomyces sp. ISL-100]|uniref:hypothetical protein n=1 Tax=Streptomyces sp. ISL-100 TaxID=2819173 RepID=UPI002034B2BB|nr:hypothetical protein [Streptomyces sp. ISL-100]